MYNFQRLGQGVVTTFPLVDVTKIPSSVRGNTHLFTGLKCIANDGIVVHREH